jgi:hypothetical protein
MKNRAGNSFSQAFHILLQSLPLYATFFHSDGLTRRTKSGQNERDRRWCAADFWPTEAQVLVQLRGPIQGRRPIVS